jgi:helix-turn-helix protein
VSREHEVRFPDKFWRRETHLSHDAKALYATLATFADYRTGLTFVSNARLQSETRYGRDLVKKLLRELEAAGYIKRSRQTNRNLLSKRWIRCLKYVVSDGLNFSQSSRRTDSQSPEKQPTVFTPVKSSVTPETKKSHLYPTQDHSDSESEKETIM